jgi:queuine/archaeosine tRNA-ribosyltransferase
VFPTRTARFGVALTFKGPLNLSRPIVVNIVVHTEGLNTELGKHTTSMEPIDKDCPCPTCASGMSRAMLHHVVTIETAGAHGNSDSDSAYRLLG